MELLGKLRFKCKNCGSERVKNNVVDPIFWVTCRNCKQKNLSLIENKCVNCDSESKKKLEEFEAS